VSYLEAGGFKKKDILPQRDNDKNGNSNVKYLPDKNFCVFSEDAYEAPRQHQRYGTAHSNQGIQEIEGSLATPASVEQDKGVNRSSAANNKK